MGAGGLFAAGLDSRLLRSVEGNQVHWKGQQEDSQYNEIFLLPFFQLVYFTALFPYVILIILLIRAATLPGQSYTGRDLLKTSYQSQAMWTA